MNHTARATTDGSPSPRTTIFSVNASNAVPGLSSSSGDAQPRAGSAGAAHIFNHKCPGYITADEVPGIGTRRNAQTAK